MGSIGQSGCGIYLVQAGLGRSAGRYIVSIRWIGKIHSIPNTFASVLLLNSIWPAMDLAVNFRYYSTIYILHRFNYTINVKQINLHKGVVEMGKINNKSTLAFPCKTMYNKIVAKELQKLFGKSHRAWAERM
jgi:hypothetical protein